MEWKHQTPNCKGDEVKPLRDPAGVAGSPGTQSPSQQKTPVILSCRIKFSCRSKYRRLDGVKFTIPLHLTLVLERIWWLMSLGSASSVISP